MPGPLREKKPVANPAIDPELEEELCRRSQVFPHPGDLLTAVLARTLQEIDLGHQIANPSHDQAAAPGTIGVLTLMAGNIANIDVFESHIQGGGAYVL